MNPIKQGQWQISSVDVNGRSSDEIDGFRVLMSSGDRWQLMPAEITFKINQATSRSAVLESRSQIFFADFFVRGEKLTLNITRPAFADRIHLEAVFLPSAVANFS